MYSFKLWALWSVFFNALIIDVYISEWKSIILTQHQKWMPDSPSNSKVSVLTHHFRILSALCQTVHLTSLSWMGLDPSSSWSSSSSSLSPWQWCSSLLLKYVLSLNTALVNPENKTHDIEFLINLIYSTHYCNCQNGFNMVTVLSRQNLKGSIITNISNLDTKNIAGDKNSGT